MRPFRCAGCEAKDAEIARLVADKDRLTTMLEKLQGRLAEIAEPGLAARMARVERPQDFTRQPPRPVARRDAFPGYAAEPPPVAIEVADER